MNDLQDRLDSSFGPGPAHQPLEPLLLAGHRAVRRRRLAAAGGALAVVAVVGVGITAVSASSDGDRALQPATQQTSSPAPRPSRAQSSLPGLQVSASGPGKLAVRNGRIGMSIGPVFGHHGQEAYGYEVFDAAGVRMFVLTRGTAVQLDRAPDGTELWAWLTKQGWSTEEPAGSDPAPTGSTSPLVSVSGSELRAKPGVTIIDQRSDLGLPASFAPDSATTIGGLVERDGVSYYVLYRVLDGRGEFLTVPAAEHADTLPAFLDEARAAYESGEGLL